jgi:hypothetical protein
MDPKRALKQDGKVFDVVNVAKTERYLKPDYRCEAGTGTREPTGKLTVFRLIPRDEKLPSFEARWDGGNRETNRERFDLDIDIQGVSKSEKRKFEKGGGGYSGHHATEIPVTEGHAYEVSIATPAGKIFDGTVSFTLCRQQEISVSVPVQASLDIQVIRAKPKV